MTTKYIWGLLIIFCLFYSQAIAQEHSSQEQRNIDYSTTTGPSNGSLVIVGGSMQDPSILDTFMQHAGGKEANIVVVPTAAADSIPQEYLGRIKQRFINSGIPNVTVLHTKDRSLADSDSFVAPIQEADGVWFTGGRQWRIVDSYMNTLTQKEFENVLKRGGVIGGSSAGATIQGSYLARGDTKTNTIMMGDHEKGFAYIKNVAIDQHLLQRNRQFDLIEIIRAKPHLLGIGLDENTAIVVEGNEFEVIGESYVAVYNHEQWKESGSNREALPNGGKFILLKAEEKYDLQKRVIVEDQ